MNILRDVTIVFEISDCNLCAQGATEFSNPISSLSTLLEYSGLLLKNNHTKYNFRVCAGRMGKQNSLLMGISR